MNSSKSPITINIENTNQKAFENVDIFNLNTLINKSILIKTNPLENLDVFFKLFNSIQFDSKDFKVSSIKLVTNKEKIDKKITISNKDNLWGGSHSEMNIFKTDKLQTIKSIVDCDFGSVYVACGMSIIIDNIEPKEKLTMVIFFN